MVNTIMCISYNTKQRERLYAEYIEAKKEHEKILNALDNADDTQEQEFNKILEEASIKNDFLYKSCFAAQFPKCTNKWFNKIIDELPADGSAKYLTKKQVNYFAQYAKYEDENTWRNNETYCRNTNGDYLVTFSILGYIKKQPIKA